MVNQRHISFRGFTDKLYFTNLVLTWIYTILCLIFSILGDNLGIQDYSFVTIVCPLVWAELGVHTGFVVHKARVENLSKWTGDSIIHNANMNINMDI